MGQILDAVVTDRGIFIMEVNLNHMHILWIFLITQVLFIFPTLVVDMVLTNNDYDDCLLANFTCQDALKQCPQVTVPFTLGLWLVIDGITKLMFLMMITSFRTFGTDLGEKQFAISISGNIIRGFYGFELGWTIAASILFWGEDHGFPKPAYTYCKPLFKNYLFFLLIYTFILIPINIFIGSLRPKPQRLTEEYANQSMISYERTISKS